MTTEESCGNSNAAPGTMKSASQWVDQTYLIENTKDGEDWVRQIQQDALNSAWEAINKAIKLGVLHGNGTDETATRNGLILATNEIAKMMSPNT